MMTLQDGTFHIFTFKDGLLARLAHDLRLSLGRYEVTVDQDQVEGRFWLDSLEVDGAMSRGTLDASELSPRDKKTIQGNLCDKVLHTGRHPEATFSGTRQELGGGRYRVTGQLTLMGRPQPVSLEASGQDGVYSGSAELVPSRWGIKPFKALGGAIKLQDKLKLEFALKA
jgi:polyisoprenoid-binding protein YceI